MDNSFHVLVNSQRIEVSWGQKKVWLMHYSVENWRMVLDFVSHARTKGLEVDVVRN